MQRRPASSGFIVPWISPPQSGSVLPQGPAAFRGEAASSAGGSGGGGQGGLRRAPVSSLEPAEGGGQRRGRERRGGREWRRWRHPGRGAPRAVLHAGAWPLPVMRRGGVVPRSLGEAVPVRAAGERSDFLHLALVFLLGAAAFDGGSVQLRGRKRRSVVFSQISDFRLSEFLTHLVDHHGVGEDSVLAMNHR